MRSRPSKEWSWPPPDQWVALWGVIAIAVIGILTSRLISFFVHLTGTRWILCYAMALLVAAFGTSLLVYAKLPLYRQRRFFTFGSKALPENGRSFYRWGYRCLFFAAALLLGLLSSKP